MFHASHNAERIGDMDHRRRLYGTRTCASLFPHLASFPLFFSLSLSLNFYEILGGILAASPRRASTP